MIRSSNPGRWAAVESSVLKFEVERASTDRVGVKLVPFDPVATEAEAEAMMRALADVLGYEIGARIEL